MRSIIKKFYIIPCILLALVFLMGAEDCSGRSDEEKAQQKTRNAAVDDRYDNLRQAEKVAPQPRQANFPLRRALVEMTKREDLLNHPWYLYFLGDNGNTIGYFVSKYPPINGCAFLSSTEEVHTEWEGTTVLTAPSLDGIYYGGSGSSASCDLWVVFDITTGAMVKVIGLKAFVADAPLRVDAGPVKIASR